MFIPIKFLPGNLFPLILLPGDAGEGDGRPLVWGGFGVLGLFGEEPNNCSIPGPQIRALVLFPKPRDGSQLWGPAMTSPIPDQPVGGETLLEVPLFPLFPPRSDSGDSHSSSRESFSSGEPQNPRRLRNSGASNLALCWQTPGCESGPGFFQLSFSFRGWVFFFCVLWVCYFFFSPLCEAN